MFETNSGLESGRLGQRRTKMEAFKIIFVLLFCGYCCEGHFRRNFDSRKFPAMPSLDFQTFPEYFKPLYRIRYLPPSSTIPNRFQPFTPKPTIITNNQKQMIPSHHHGNGMLSIIKNVMRPFMGKMEHPYEMVKQPAKGPGTMNEHHRNHAIHLKLIPKLVKKEVTRQLGTIFGKEDKVINNLKQEINKTEDTKVDAIDITNNKEYASGEHLKLNETREDEIKKKTGFINKFEAKSIFGNFVGNKHFANIFIFYPNNDNSALVVGLKDNMTNVFTESPTETSIINPKHPPIDKKEENMGTENDDKDLEENNDNNESSTKKADDTTVQKEDTVTADNIIVTSSATVSTTGTSENQDQDNKHTDNDEDDLSSNKDSLNEANESSSENGIEDEKHIKDPIKEDNFMHDQVKNELKDTLNETDIEAIEVPDKLKETPDTILVTSTTKNTNVINSEGSTTTEFNEEVTTNAESETIIPSDTITKPTTIDLSETVSTGDRESANVESEIENDNTLEDTTDDYMEIEYVYY